MTHPSKQEQVATTKPTFTKHQNNYQSNLFTESRQEFTELEKKIVTLVVNQLGNMAVKGEIEPKVNVLLQVPINTLTKAHYDQITDAAESLSKKRMSFKNEKTGDFTFITPFPLVQSNTVNGLRVIEITMLANVVPYFAELGQRYTKYDIDVMLSLSSVYAQRMFEIVSMFYNRGQRQFRYGVEQLRTILNCPETYRYNDFVINALGVAQKELTSKANLLLEWSPTKKVGKRVVELEFVIKTTRQLAVEGVEQDRQTINQMPIHEAVQRAWSLMADYKLKSWQKEMIVADHALLEIFYRVHVELINGLRSDVKNRTAYLVKSLGIDKAKEPKSGKTPQARTLEIPFLAAAPPASPRAGTTQSIASILGEIITPSK